MNKINNICNNCGKQGHLFSQCKQSIISYGVILFCSTDNGLKYLMIRRKNTFGYIDFIRGKYMLNNYQQIKLMFNEMTSEEKNNITMLSFDELWANMWGEGQLLLQYRSEELHACKKFEALKKGIICDGEQVDLTSLTHNSGSLWSEPEWEFPKGRRNYQEKDLDCALREFEEETGISKDNINVVENLLPFEEIYIGSNYKSYKHKFFLANATSENVDLSNYQQNEVSKLEWKNLDDCLNTIRPYSLEKKQLITNINKVLEEYRLY